MVILLRCVSEEGDEPVQRICGGPASGQQPWQDLAAVQAAI